MASLKDQIELLKGGILFLRQELQEKNVTTKYKCIASPADDAKFDNNNKDNNSKHNKNQNNNNKNIIGNLDNNPISNYNTNNTEYTNNDNKSNMIIKWYHDIPRSENLLLLMQTSLKDNKGSDSELTMIFEIEQLL